MPKFLVGIGPAPRAQKARRSYAPESHFADIVAGDYVVHSEYGIGRFLGLVVRAISDSDREYLKIEYQRRHLVCARPPCRPAEQMDGGIRVCAQPAPLGGQAVGRIEAKSAEGHQRNGG
jgi:hypothetical protein